jgi:hypothetical protein
MVRRAKETRVIRIPVIKGKPWASACFLASYLAYPEQTSEDDKQRSLFYAALLVWQEVRHMRHLDQTLREKFVDGESLFRTFKKGINKIVDCLTAGHSVTYHLFDLKTEDGLANTVENLALVQARFLGSRSVNSASTYLTRKWGPSSPVLHLATAFLLYCMDNEGYGELSLFYHFMFHHKALARLVAVADGLHLILPNCRNIYRDYQFIKFEFIPSTAFPSRGDDDKFRMFMERVRQADRD